MHPVLSFPVLAGMSYPQLQAGGLLRIVDDPPAIKAMARSERVSVSILMTSASRGCSAEIADWLPSLRLVVSQGVGTERIDTRALSERGIQVRPIGETLTEDVADLAMALTLMSCRRLIAANHFARQGDWRASRFEPGDSIFGKTMGIAGLSGRIGQAIAARAKVSGMTIVGLDRPSNQAFGVRLFPDMTALCAASDVVVLALPGSDDLKHAIGRPQLRALGGKGRLINIGRGSLVDTPALIEALEQGIIAGAGLDVLEGEPDVPPRLAALPNVVLTPHIGGNTWGQRARAARIAEDEVISFLARTSSGSAPGSTSS